MVQRSAAFLHDAHCFLYTVFTTHNFPVPLHSTRLCVKHKVQGPNPACQDISYGPRTSPTALTRSSPPLCFSSQQQRGQQNTSTRRVCHSPSSQHLAEFFLQILCSCSTPPPLSPPPVLSIQQTLAADSSPPPDTALSISTPQPPIGSSTR